MPDGWECNVDSMVWWQWHVECSRWRDMISETGTQWFVCLSVCVLFTCELAMSRYFWWHLFVHLSIHTNSRKLLIRNWYNLVEICPMVNARIDWNLVALTFDRESYFCTSSTQAIYFEWLGLVTLFSVWRYIFRISRSRSSFKVMGLISRSRSQNSSTAQVYAPLGDSLICVMLFVTVLVTNNLVCVCVCICLYRTRRMQRSCKWLLIQHLCHSSQSALHTRRAERYWRTWALLWLLDRRLLLLVAVALGMCYVNFVLFYFVIAVVVHLLNCLWVK